jgi:ribosomal protein L2
VRQAGTYRIALSAGTYAVRATSRRQIDPTTVRVPSGRFRRVDFSIDTGIR